MNIVFVKHSESKEFAFRVPDDLVSYIKKGNGVLCETMHGIDYGTTTTGVISGEGALDIALANGAYLPIKPIVGFVHPELAKAPTLQKIIVDECLDKISKSFQQPQNNPPE